MIILGLNAFGENPSACLIRNGILVAFCNEERFNRLKGSFGLFPSRAVLWCLNSQQINLQDVNKIAFYWGCNKYPRNMFVNLVKMKASIITRKANKFKSSINTGSDVLSAIEQLYKFSPGNIKKSIRDHLRIFGHKGPIPDIEFVDHHLAHAYQTYYQSPFDDAIVLVVDGHGEEDCVSGYSIKRGYLRKILGYQIPESLGWFYGAFTAYLGFIANRDEGKLMGLAAYGENRKNSNPWLSRFDKILKITSDGFKIDPLFLKFGGNECHPRFTDHLVKYITSFNSDLTPIGINEFSIKDGKKINKYLLDDYIDLAFAVQSKLEEALSSLVSYLVRETGIKNLCLAGGVAMNCKANSYIYDNTDIENIFIHPASSDDGSCIGASFYIAEQFGENIKNDENILKHVQLGPSYSNDEIEKALKVCNISYKKSNDICFDSAKLITNGKFVGWFQGGLEMGARALGGRSIIACPEQQDVKDKINEKVKFREKWRPYCPSLLAEFQNDYIEDSIDSPFMILARKAKTKLKKNAPSIVHIDDTIRPQTVEKSVLPKWHNLIDNVRSLSGYPVILNTSFNVRGEPIVCNPHDAIRTFYSTGLDALAIGDFLVSK